MILEVPTFARLSDYAGFWLCEPLYSQKLWQIVGGIDLAAHVKGGEPEPMKSLVEKVPAPGGKSVSVIRLTGLLMKSASSFGGTSTVQARREIRAAAADPDVSGILLAIDSPGGTVAGTDDLARDVKAAGRTKPVWAHAEDLLASAAYWVASQAQRITANSPTALVGSIGTLQVINDLSAAAEKEGIRTMVFSTGPLKGLGTPGSKVTEEQASHVQSLVNSIQEQFDSAVQKGRGLGAKELAAVRHGGVMTATQALDAKLIDGIQPLQKTLAELTAETKLPRGAAADASDTRQLAGSLPRLPRQLLPMRS